MEYIIYAQIFGLLGSVAMLLSNWQKTKTKILSLLIIDSFCYCMQYLLLGALTGVFTNIIGLIRIIIFKYKRKINFLQNKIILYIIIALYIVIGIITYDKITSILPMLGAAIYTITLWNENVKNIRIGSLIMLFAYFVYNITVSAFVGALVEGLLLTSTILSIIKLDILPNNTRIHISKNKTI